MFNRGYMKSTSEAGSLSRGLGDPVGAPQAPPLKAPSIRGDVGRTGEGLHEAERLGLGRGDLRPKDANVVTTPSGAGSSPMSLPNPSNGGGGGSSKAGGGEVRR